MAMSTGWLPPASIEAERAIRSLNRLKVVVDPSRAVLRISSFRRRDDFRADVNELGIVRAFSILESYLSERGDTIIRRELPVPTPPPKLVEYAHLHLMASLRGNFDRGPVRLWRRGLGVEINNFRRRKDVDDLRELRNLVTHALGYVRPGGTPLPASLNTRLTRLTSDPASYVGRIPVTDDDVGDALALVREFVVWVDAQRP